MRGRTIGRLVACAGSALVASTLAPGVAGASGGGGCGGPVTEATGTTVAIEDMCFGPTILHVSPGEEITFVNEDRTPHTVLGANGAWGSFEALKRNAEATYGFTEPGIYPYVCTWHPGMIGAIVVGDGVGGAIDTTTAEGPVIPASMLSGGQPVPSSGLDPGAGMWIGLAATGGVLVGAAGAWRLRRRR